MVDRWILNGGQLVSTVVITRADQIETAIDKALEHIPLEQLVRGKLVAVKPNDTWASPKFD